MSLSTASQFMQDGWPTLSELNSADGKLLPDDTWFVSDGSFGKFIPRFVQVPCEPVMRRDRQIILKDA